jgi:hypothetical protein
MPHEYYNTHGVLGRRLGSARAAGYMVSNAQARYKKSRPKWAGFLAI